MSGYEPHACTSLLITENKKITVNAKDVCFYQFQLFALVYVIVVCFNMNLYSFLLIETSLCIFRNDSQHLYINCSGGACWDEVHGVPRHGSFGEAGSEDDYYR